MNLQTKSEIFDVLYAVAQRAIHYYNPCRFKDGVCVYGKPNGCCSGFVHSGFVHSVRYKNRFICQHLDEDKGCTIRCLGCQLFYCTCNGRQIPELTERETLLFYNEMEVIRKIATECGIDVACFCTKEDAISHP